MTTHQTSDLDGFDLSRAVAIAAGMEWRELMDDTYRMVQVYRTPETPGLRLQGYWTIFTPGKSWDDAGPLLTAEEISLSSRTSPVHRHGGPNAGRGIAGCWSATTWHKGVNGSRSIECHETSPLIAAMRCYVASKLGDTVELP